MATKKRTTTPKTKAAPKKRAASPKAKVESTEPAVPKYFKIFELPSGHMTYRVAPTKAACETGEQLGKLHKSIANYPEVERRWRKDAESKGLKEA